MNHRGPDDGGVEIVDDGGQVVGLCARRLAIQDLSPRGHQPMSSVESGSWICLNGEIYNASDLRGELAAKGHRFHGSSDTEVVLAAFDEWGPECFVRLRGMFAVAIWDMPGHRLVLARDRLGIKPIYLSDDGRRLLFASEVRALVATGLMAPSLSLDGMASYLGLGAIEEPDTILAGVRALPPGHYATWEGGAVREMAYWSLADRFANPTSNDRAEAAALVRAQLEDAVRRHLVSDAPLGVFLSGGIDSSALVALVATVSGQPPQTVSVVFPQRRWSEERYIRMVVERYRTRHTEIVLDEAEVLAQVPSAMAALDQPTFDGVNTYVVSGQARAAGLTVALSGIGGDELFAGYDTFRIAPQLERIRQLMPRAAGPMAAAVTRVVLNDNDRGRKLARWLAAREQGLCATALRRELFAPHAVAGLLGGYPPRGGLSQPALDLADPVNRISFLELNRYMRNVLLRDADVLSMAHGLEVRVPFLDHELVELVVAMPGPLKTPGATLKPLLVEAVSDLVPPEVVHRPKRGFALPFPVWLRGPLRGQVEAALLDPGYGGQVSGMLDPNTVAAVWQRFLDGRAEWVRPWSLFALKTWGETLLPVSAATPTKLRS